MKINFIANNFTLKASYGIVKKYFLYLFLTALIGWQNCYAVAPGSSCANPVLVASSGCTGPYDNTGFVGTTTNPGCFGGGAKNFFYFTFIASIKARFYANTQ